MAKRPKRGELSSREDFIIDQFPTMKKINTLAMKLFNIYYIDVERNSELSPMMRGMVPTYYVDPMNPEHPGCYTIAGKSSVDYLERIMYVTPYVSEKGKYELDISAWKGLLMPATEFHTKIKGFRKTKLEPLVVMTERPDGENCPQSLILREDATKAKDEAVLPFLMLPNRRREGEDAYLNAIKSLVYDPFYAHLIDYLKAGLKFEGLSQEDVNRLKDEMYIEIMTKEDGPLTLTKNILPNIGPDQRLSIAKVPNPHVDESTGKRHYVICEEILNELGTPAVTIYTLMAMLSFNV